MSLEISVKFLKTICKGVSFDKVTVSRTTNNNEFLQGSFSETEFKIFSFTPSKYFIEMPSNDGI